MTGRIFVGTGTAMLSVINIFGGMLFMAFALPAVVAGAAAWTVLGRRKNLRRRMRKPRHLTPLLKRVRVWRWGFDLSVWRGFDEKRLPIWLTIGAEILTNAPRRGQGWGREPVCYKSRASNGKGWRWTLIVGSIRFELTRDWIGRYEG